MKKWYRLPLPKSVIYLSQYIPLKILTTLFQSFPVRASAYIGRLLGRTVHFFNWKHRCIARTNLNNAWPGKLSPHQTSNIVRRIYEHFGMSFAHTAYMNRLLHKHNWSKYIRFKNLELLDRLLKQRQGVILVGAHQGNWEVTLYTLGLAGYPMNLVAYRMFNPMVNSVLEHSRTYRHQLKIIYTKGAIETGIEILKRGEIVIFLADLTGRGYGLPVQFFGQTAPCLGGPANLALKTLSPLLPFYSYMTKQPFNYTAGFDEPILPVPTDDKDKDMLTLTQQYTSRIENIIRRHPEQWVWFHRKWKQYPREIKTQTKEKTGT